MPHFTAVGSVRLQDTEACKVCHSLRYSIQFVFRDADGFFVASVYADVCVQMCTGLKETCVRRPSCSSIHCRLTSKWPALYDHMQIIHMFLLCNAMLGWYMLWHCPSCVCRSVCLSVCHKSVFYHND